MPWYNLEKDEIAPLTPVGNREFDGRLDDEISRLLFVISCRLLVSEVVLLGKNHFFYLYYCYHTYSLWLHLGGRRNESTITVAPSQDITKCPKCRRCGSSAYAPAAMRTASGIQTVRQSGSQAGRQQTAHGPNAHTAADSTWATLAHLHRRGRRVHDRSTRGPQRCRLEARRARDAGEQREGAKKACHVLGDRLEICNAGF